MSATLIQNGDFEWLDSRVGDAGHRLDELGADPSWDVYTSLPGGWYTTGGPGIEVQTDAHRPAHSGRLYIELDSHSNSMMTQDVLIVTGGDYVLEFAYQPRSGTQNDNGIAVLLGEQELGYANGVATSGSDWQIVTFEIEGLVAGTHRLSFAATGLSNSFGGLLDSVSLVRATDPNVPEPTAALLFGTGAAIIARRKRPRA